VSVRFAERHAATHPLTADGFPVDYYESDTFD
jgi:hypothetical protein